MWCDLVESVTSREHWLWEITRKRNEFLLFSIVIILRILQLLKFGLEPLVRFKWGFSAKCASPNGHFHQIENWKCHMFDIVRLHTDFPRSHHIWSIIQKFCNKKIYKKVSKTFELVKVFEEHYIFQFKNC